MHWLPARRSASIAGAFAMHAVHMEGVKSQDCSPFTSFQASHTDAQRQGCILQLFVQRHQLLSISSGISPVGARAARFPCSSITCPLHNTSLLYPDLCMNSCVNSCVTSQGEEQKKLDVISNDIFCNCLRMSGRTGVIASEEEATPVAVEETDSGNYIVVFDPLDGSSNIDAGEQGVPGSAETAEVWSVQLAMQQCMHANLQTIAGMAMPGCQQTDAMMVTVSFTSSQQLNPFLTDA